MMSRLISFDLQLSITAAVEKSPANVTSVNIFPLDQAT